MAQVAIREYDAKKMYFESIWKNYSGIQIQEISDLEKLNENTKYVIKPDMLFWKRGKRWLLWIGLSKSECISWFKKHKNKLENIDWVNGTLDIFLVEELIESSVEYYLAFSQSRTWDILHFSLNWWVDIEENWKSVISLTIPVTETLNDSHLWKLWNIDTDLKNLIVSLWEYYRSYGFVSLEFNPISRNTWGDLILLDAVAKVDDTEHFLQKEHWKGMQLPNNFGFKENTSERYIRELDTQTWASLKLKILNPDARIWTLFAGGGWSLVMTDSLWTLGFANEIWNYGECSGNPSREFTKEYTKVLLSELLANQKKGKYLIIAWAIANFTHIDKTFAGIIDALKEHIDEIQKQEIVVLVRRWWINEKKWLQILEDACKELKIPAIITGSDAYMTTILNEIKL